jgi:ankyrin repeat protein
MALSFSAWYSHRTVVSLLLAHGASARLSAPFAVRGYSHAITALVLAHGAYVNASISRVGSALHCALRDGDSKILSLLLRHGADLHAISRVGWWTTVYTATSFLHPIEHTSVVKLLFVLGADPNVRVQVWDDAEGTSLHLAAREGHADGMSLHVERGVDVDTRASSGWTPLHIAVRCRRVGATGRLLHLGASRPRTTAGRRRIA